MKPIICGAVLYNPLGTHIEVAVVKGFSTKGNIIYLSIYYHIYRNSIRCIATICQSPRYWRCYDLMNIFLYMRNER